MKKIENIFDTQGAALYVGVHRPKIYQYVAEGRLIPFIDIPHHQLFRKIDLDALKKELKK